MTTKRKYIALLGLISLLAVPLGAYGRSADGVSGDPLTNTPRQLLAAGNPGSAAASDPESLVPVLVAADPLFEFGRVLDGTEVAHDFLIENRGSGDLRIDRVVTG